jgi:hypothetical protein
VSAEVAEWFNKFDGAVLTVVDSDGYPASIRVDPRAYDVATGELPTTLSDELHAAEGPAGLLCHSHDEKLWNLQMIDIKGHIEKRQDAWAFVVGDFQPPSKLAFLSFIRGARRAANKYLERRGLKRPEVNWAAVKEIQRRARTASG